MERSRRVAFGPGGLWGSFCAGIKKSFREGVVWNVIWKGFAISVKPGVVLGAGVKCKWKYYRKVVVWQINEKVYGSVCFGVVKCEITKLTQGGHVTNKFERDGRLPTAIGHLTDSRDLKSGGNSRRSLGLTFRHSKMKLNKSKNKPLWHVHPRGMVLGINRQCRLVSCCNVLCIHCLTWLIQGV